jgi:hypothetical protein
MAVPSIAGRCENRRRRDDRDRRPCRHSWSMTRHWAGDQWPASSCRSRISSSRRRSSTGVCRSSLSYATCFRIGSTDSSTLPTCASVRARCVCAFASNSLSVTRLASRSA